MIKKIQKDFSEEDSDDGKNLLWDEIKHLEDQIELLECNYPWEKSGIKESKETLYKRRDELFQKLLLILDEENLDYDEDIDDNGFDINEFKDDEVITERISKYVETLEE